MPGKHPKWAGEEKGSENVPVGGIKGKGGTKKRSFVGKEACGSKRPPPKKNGDYLRRDGSLRLDRIESER